MTIYSLDDMPSTALTYPGGLWIARGLVTNHSDLVKYGHNGSVGTSFEPVTTGAALQLPQPSGAQPLRVVSTSADDNAAGSGAQAVRVAGLDPSGNEIEEILPTNGTSPSAVTSQPFWRLLFADVVASGSYSDLSTGGHDGNITIEDAASNNWGQIDSNGYPHSRMQSTWYTVPSGCVAYAQSLSFATASRRETDFKILSRPGANLETGPFTPMVELLEQTGIDDSFTITLNNPLGPLPAFTDIGVTARTSTGTSDVSAFIDLILIKSPQ